MNMPVIPPHRPDAGYRCLHDFAHDAEIADHRRTRMALGTSVALNIVLAIFLICVAVMQ